jgi:glycosyltransferase involved in cell wall biosynthesis
VVFKRLFQTIVKPKRILFYRDLQAYYGGHQKVADYFEHLQTSLGFVPEIFFSEASRWDKANPWFNKEYQKTTQYKPEAYDYVFVAGMDWSVYLNTPKPLNQPVINFIQHVRHADPTENLHQFLSQPAIRICVAQQVTDAILATGKVNGPVFTIANGLELPALSEAKQWDVFILGNKQPVLAADLAAELRASGLRVLVVDQWMPRDDLYVQMAASRLALLLPHPTEGFYLPALEAMHFCDLVVVPDAIGNRAFCIKDTNCLMPEYTQESISLSLSAGLEILNNSALLRRYKVEAKKTVENFSLQRERREFLSLMKQVDVLWANYNFNHVP